MKIIRTSLPDVKIVQSAVFSDARGAFLEVFHQTKFAELGLPHDFSQDNNSTSTRGVLRGLHYQLSNPQGKLVFPVFGSIFDVAVDLRRSSATFGRWVGETLVAGDGRKLWIPPGFAHGFYVLGESASVFYKCTTEYDAASDRSLRWNDTEIGIEWPLETGALPVLSAKDSSAPFLADASCFE